MAGEQVLGKAVLELSTDSTHLEAGLDKAKKHSFGVFNAVNKAAKLAIAGAGVAVLSIAKIGLSEAMQAEKITAITDAVVKSTGGAANVSTEHVKGLANSLMQLSGVDDEAIQGAQNMLLTFTNIKNVGADNIFDQVSAAVLDMDMALTQGNSTAESLKGSAVMLGKAMQDPIHGMAALSKVGALNRDDMAKLKKSWGDNTPVLKQQADLLAALKVEFDGTAKAAGSTLAGSMNKVRQSFSNAAGEVMASLMPMLANLATWVSAHMPEIQAIMTSVLTRITNAIRTASHFIGEAIDFYREHKDIINALVPVLGALVGAIYVMQAAVKAYIVVQRVLNLVMAMNPIGLVVAALAVLGVALYQAWTKSATFRDIVHKVWARVKETVSSVLDFFRETIPATFKSVLDTAKGYLNSFTGFFTRTIPDAFHSVLGWVKKNWPLIAIFIAGPFGPLVALATNAFGIRDKLQGAFSAILAFGKKKLGDLRDFFVGLKDSLVSSAKSIGAAIIDGIADGFGGLLDTLKKKIEGGLRRVLGSLNPFSPVKHGGEIYIGIPLVQGAIDGWEKGLSGLQSSISKGISFVVKGVESVSRDQVRDMWAGLKALWVEGKSMGNFEPTRLWDGMGVEEIAGKAKVATARALLKAMLSAGKELGDLAHKQSVEEAKALKLIRDKQAKDLKDHLAALANILKTGRSAFAAAFQTFANAGLSAFDAQTKSRLDKLSSTLQAAFASIDSGRSALTPAEMALRDLQAGNAQEGRDRALADALESEDAQRIADARYSQKVFELGQQAALERTAADAAAEAARTALQKTYDLQALNLSAARALEREHFQTQLSQLEGHMSARGLSVETSNAKMKALFQKFGVDPSFHQAGVDLGSAFTRGLREKMAGIWPELNRVRAAIHELSMASIPSSQPSGYSMIGPMPHLASGGIVNSPTVALLGEKGPEAVVPLSGAGGAGFGTRIEVNVSGVVGNARDVAVTIGRELEALRSRGMSFAF